MMVWQSHHSPLTHRRNLAAGLNACCCCGKPSTSNSAQSRSGDGGGHDDSGDGGAFGGANGIGVFGAAPQQIRVGYVVVGESGSVTQCDVFSDGTEVCFLVSSP